MKIVQPSATIIEDELAQLSIYQRIDACASVCYQRPPKPTEEEAQEFCRKMVNIKHMSTLEMARVSLVVENVQLYEYLYCVDKTSPAFFLVTSHATLNDALVVTGSIRAFLEASQPQYITECKKFLSKEYPLLVMETEGEWYGENVRFAAPEEIPWHHKHVAARFIVNRAVSHELVRHRPISVLQESQRYCRYEDDIVFIEPEWVTKSEAHRWISDVWKSQVRSCEGSYKELMRNGLKPQQARAVLPNSTKTELICYASLPQWLHMFNLRCSPAADPEMRRVMIPLREEFKEKYKEVEW